MSQIRRVVHVCDQVGPGREPVMLVLDASTGAALAVNVPATDWNVWSGERRAYAARISGVSAKLRQGVGLAAQREEAERRLALLLQLEDAETLAALPARGRACVSAKLRQGVGLAAQREEAERLLALLLQLEDAETLAALPARGRA